jgi:hypothetical protein
MVASFGYLATPDDISSTPVDALKNTSTAHPFGGLLRQWLGGGAGGRPALMLPRYSLWPAISTMP